MSALPRLSWSRFVAMLRKEFIQLRRDRPTAAMIFGIPIMQLFLFGFVINSDPRHLPTAVLDLDGGPHARTVLAALKNTGYYDIANVGRDETEARDRLSRGEVQFVVNIPPNFSRDLERGARPALLIEADAADPMSAQPGLSALSGAIETALLSDLKGPLASLAPQAGPVEVRIHALYNPERITSHNIVPGLMGVVLTLTLVIITALAITRERERGTMETLLATPLRPAEVLVGKIALYVVIGYIQIAIIILAARFVFSVPIQGNLLVLMVGSLFFIVANLSIGITFSTVAKNQLQALQMAMFIFLPSMLLSGFMFPFRGMPPWAQFLGEILPITHFMRIARGVMLKGTGFAELAHEIWPMALFTVVVMTVGIRRYRMTLD